MEGLSSSPPITQRAEAPQHSHWHLIRSAK